MNAPKFQLNSSCLFLTFPRCTATKETALDFFTKLLAPRDYVIASELHANGDPHLHCYFKLDQAYRTRSCHALDLIDGETRYHGSYEGCRSSKKVIKYCTKAENYISNIDVAGMLSSGTTRALLGKRLLDGEPLEQIVSENPSLLFGYSRLVQDLNLFKSHQQKPPEVPDNLPNPWGLDLPYLPQRKQRHYWIWSARPNAGKTTGFGSPLSRDYGFYFASGDFQYWDVNVHTPGIILDDYNHAALKVSVLNKMCDGTYSFRIFNGGVRQLARYTVIVLSNKRIGDVYPNYGELLHARFLEICVDSKPSSDIDYTKLLPGHYLSDY